MNNNIFKTTVTVNEVVTKENVDFNKVYLYTNLDKFTRHPRNRRLDFNHCKYFKKSMLTGTADDNLIGEMKIDINTNQIYDGQHRIQAYKDAVKEGYNKPLRVMFINAPEDVNEQITLINELNNGKHWNINDHINSHKGGDNDLLKLEAFCLSHELLYREIKKGKDKGKKTPFMRRGAAVITGKKSYYRTALRDGTFKASKEDWEDAENIYSEVVNILNATKLSKQADIPALEGIILAWFAVHNDKRMAKKIESLPNGLNDVYEYMTPSNMDVRHTTSADIWEDRFRTAVENAYTKHC